MTVATLEQKTAPVGTRTMDPASQFERYDTINTPQIVVVGFISAIMTFVAILAAQALFFATDHAEAQRKLAAQNPTALTEGLTQQQNRLAGYGWVNSDKGIVSIPVSDAMRLVVEEQQTPRESVTE